MKVIFDFDDVLFENTKKFKPHMYACLEKSGIPRADAEAYYQEVRENQFSLEDFVSVLCDRFKKGDGKEYLYKEIMSKCKEFLNEDLMHMVKELGQSNCYIVTNGEEKFQRDKIEAAGISTFFSEVFIVPDSKKETIYTICKKHEGEKVVFVEDKEKFLQDINLGEVSNLKAILYDESGLEKLKREVA